MAYDKIVDSTALDTALTDIADAIRTKTGKTDSLTIEQMPSEIESISGGGSEFERKVTSFIYYPDAPDEEFVAVLPNVTSLRQAFYFNKIGTALKSIDITVSNKLTDMSQFARNTYSVNTVILRGDLSGVTTYRQAFLLGTVSRTLTTVKGLDFTSATDITGIFANQYGLSTLEIEPDTVNISLPIPNSPLSATSCVNVLNALKDRTGQDALTLTLKATLTNAESGTINVNYVKLDADTGLYVLCEQTDEGAMTIAAAITSKNWTIA